MQFLIVTDTNVILTPPTFRVKLGSRTGDRPDVWVVYIETTCGNSIESIEVMGGSHDACQKVKVAIVDVIALAYKQNVDFVILPFTSEAIAKLLRRD